MEEIIGRKVEHFSCPGGRFDDRVIGVVRRAGYRTMSTSSLNLNSESTSVYTLGRFAVMRDTTPEELANACSGDGLWKSNLRQTVRDSAKRVLGNRLYDGLRAKLLGSKNAG